MGAYEGKTCSPKLRSTPPRLLVCAGATGVKGTPAWRAASSTPVLPSTWQSLPLERSSLAMASIGSKSPRVPVPAMTTFGATRASRSLLGAVAYFLLLAQRRLDLPGREQGPREPLRTVAHAGGMVVDRI